MPTTMQKISWSRGLGAFQLLGKSGWLPDARIPNLIESDKAWPRFARSSDSSH